MLRANSLAAGMLLATFVAASWPAGAGAAPPWATLIPFKKIEADPSKSYELEDKHGPWIIMAASFAGTAGEQQAHDLVLELRQKFKLDAYTFRQSFDFSKPVEGNGLSKYGGRRRMRHLYNNKFDEIAVVVGNFQSLEDPQLEKTLERIKYARPQVFQREENKSSQRMGSIRDFYRVVVNDPSRKSKGPMGAAFATRNPLLPEALFTAKGLDPFVVDMNQDLPHSLLKCPGRYTVRVATFRGVDTMKPAEFERLTTQTRKYSRIDEAALKASELCKLLRQQGVEAYEFHDRT